MSQQTASQTVKQAMKSFALTSPYKIHSRSTLSKPLEQLLQKTQADSTRDELLAFHRLMFTIRRVEISCDSEYKARRIRGYLHLYDGQEAVATGTEAALNRETDDWITSYRCHGVALARGCTPLQIFAELLGKSVGTSRGKGGSMHMYRKQTNFYGGAAIVGAQVPIGAGLAFYHKYYSGNAAPSSADETTATKQGTGCAVAYYGDGAANQGQCWEAANMAYLWKLPFIFFIENNQYGMGTSTKRSSALPEYYKQGGEIIPGIQVNGMDALAMKEAMLAAKEHCVSGNGPVFVEAITYRYHGHSISDPGITYRTKDEVAKIRNAQDPIELVKKRLVEAEFATADELKETERNIRTEVQQALQEAIDAKLPDFPELFADVYTTGQVLAQRDKNEPVRMKSEYPPKIRMPDREKSYYFRESTT